MPTSGSLLRSSCRCRTHPRSRIVAVVLTRTLPGRTAYRWPRLRRIRQFLHTTAQMGRTAVDLARDASRKGALLTCGGGEGHAVTALPGEGSRPSRVGCDPATRPEGLNGVRAYGVCSRARACPQSYPCGWWRKRTWWCAEARCEAKVFTEQNDALARPRALLSARACWWAMRQLRREHASVAGIARQLGTTWRTLIGERRTSARRSTTLPGSC